MNIKIPVFFEYKCPKCSHEGLEKLLLNSALTLVKINSKITIDQDMQCPKCFECLTLIVD